MNAMSYTCLSLQKTDRKTVIYLQWLKGIIVYPYNGYDTGLALSQLFLLIYFNLLIGIRFMLPLAV